MLKFRFLIIPLALILTGAGCFNFGDGNKTATDGGVYKSTSAGSLWTQAAAVPGPKGVGTIGGRSITAMAMDKKDSSVIYIGTRDSGLLYTEDAGASWRQPKAMSLKTGEITDIETHPKDICTVYVAKGPRLYKTESCLREVNDQVYVETRSGVSLRRVAVDWFDPQVVWLAFSNGDLLKSSDGGKTWRTLLNAKAGITDLLINQQDSRIILAGTDSEGFYRSTDAGLTWTQIEKEIREYRNANRVFALAQDERSALIVAATRYGLLRSQDFGGTWSPITLLTAPGQVTVKALAVDPKDIKKIYYTAQNTFYATKDGGETWTTYQIPGTKMPEILLIDPVNTAVMYAGMVAPVK